MKSTGSKTSDVRRPTSDVERSSDSKKDSQWPLWEVFIQPGGGAPHEHAGSVHAVDAEHALQNARDTYARRGEGVNIWVVPTNAITSSTPEDMGPFFDPGNDKPYRHPQFYKVPRGVKM
ncbi:MAG: 1,2-phenylacetyl-CoA epoxidase subunit PaaB [Gemmatimonadaceae bacterium]